MMMMMSTIFLYKYKNKYFRNILELRKASQYNFGLDYEPVFGIVYVRILVEKCLVAKRCVGFGFRDNDLASWRTKGSSDAENRDNVNMWMTGERIQ